MHTDQVIVFLCLLEFRARKQSLTCGEPMLHMLSTDFRQNFLSDQVCGKVTRTPGPTGGRLQDVCLRSAWLRTRALGSRADRHYLTAAELRPRGSFFPWDRPCQAVSCSSWTPHPLSYITSCTPPCVLQRACTG